MLGIDEHASECYSLVAGAVPGGGGEMTVLSAIRFVVPGEPVPKGRARARLQRLRSGKEFIQQYTPADTRNYERSVAFEAKVAMAGRAPLTGGLVLLVHAWFGIPKSWPKWKQRDARAGLIVPTGRPDWDNVGKICSDAMNGVVYADDSAIVDACVRKRFSLDPCVVIEVRMLNPLRSAEPELLEPMESAE
ncbi:RusA family crossover junction endodeoxyribonuclease [Paraburkholderia sp. BR14320]|uniref:RusA family crossover junction endodeoxyribonuclease n=1 Tax=unclassified Paraburkholderia TaxID=2615204 RepID=UPI0034CD5B5A